eukprot:147896_1
MVKSDRHSDNRCCECTNEEITCIHPTRRAIHVNSLSAPERREQEVGHRRQQRRDEHVQDLFVGGCGDGGAKNQKQQADRTKYGRDGDSHPRGYIFTFDHVALHYRIRHYTM